MNPARLDDILTAQRIEGCIFPEPFVDVLRQVHEGYTDVDDAVAAEIAAVQHADRDLDLPRVPRWRRLLGTPAYQAPAHQVLRNLPGLTSPALVHDLTGRLCALRMAAGATGRTVDTSDGLLGLHATLFGDVFGWAGQLRFVNLSSQGIAFASVPSISHHLEKAAADLAVCREQVAATGRVPLDPLCSFLAEYLWCHPFRDGNGRTAMAVLMSLTAPGALSTVQPGEWYATSAESLQVPGFPDPEPWAPLLRRMLDHC
ncbi:Fic family protein [Corynebacterium sp. AOP40-9SA-29]|uniref:Fic family protein n=1 Tax=Corynebacterium sp. AOP40-9SA-29 TaxID=3457677 RepID=UPI004034D6EC